MLDFFVALINKNRSESNENEISDNHVLQIAACALFLEIANIDDDFTEIEKEKIFSIMKKEFSLSEIEINQLINKSEKEIEKSISVYEFTEIVNQYFSVDEKYNLIKNLWRIAYIDGNLDKYEDHYIKKISNNLHLPNKERIAAKLEVKEELGI